MKRISPLFLIAPLLISMGSLKAQPTVVLNLPPAGRVDPAFFARRLADARAPLNTTGDSATTEFLVPSCANTAGLNGAFYKTELKIATNWQSSAVAFYVEVFANGPPPVYNPAWIFMLDGNTTYLWDNILDTIAAPPRTEAPVSVGYIHVGISSSLPNASAYTIAAWANTYTASPSGGNYRTPLPIIQTGQNNQVVQRSGYPYINRALIQDPTTRNNVVVVNVDGNHLLTLRLTAFQNGFIRGAPYTVTLGPRESEQYSFASLFPGVTGSGIDIQFLPVTGAGNWLAYTVRTDNVTNDGMIELAELYDFANWPQ